MKRYIGIDPGPMPGLFVIWTGAGRIESTDVIQCSRAILPTIARSLILSPGRAAVVQVERFVVGRKSMRSGAAGRVTAELIGELVGICSEAPTAVYRECTASQVKAWATDTRLEAAGVLEVCKGMRHARDAARHALFAAVHDGGLPDPLSKEWKR